jgi:hypothetical protein
MSRLLTAPSIVAAHDLAAALLTGLPDRWRHTVGVAGRATEYAVTVPEHDRDLLVSAAWLHDIGYAAAAVDTGFHPVDGARLLEREGWPYRLACLVAHHSGAAFVARARGIADLLVEYVHERSPVSDALTYADQTTGAHGERLAITERMADMLRRHGPASANAAAHPLRERYLLAVAARVESRLGRRAQHQLA